MSNLNFVDIIFLLIFLFSIIAGFSRGFVREIVSLITLIAAFFIAIMFSNALANYLTNIPFIHNLIAQATGAAGSGTGTAISYLALGLSFGLLFAATILVGSFIGYFLNVAFQTGVLGIGNRIMGGLFGLVRGYIMVMVIVFVVQLTPLGDQIWWHQSKVVAFYQPAVAWLASMVAPSLENLKAKFGQTFQDVSSQFQGLTGSYR